MLLNNRYLIIRDIAPGGCGETLLAQDTYLPSRRQCLIKRFKPSTTNSIASHEIRVKFQKEAEISEVLGSHELIPELYALFEEDNELYIAQQWIEGLTLADKIKTAGVLDHDFVRDFLVCSLSTLSFVHSHQIIHRDIKPQNIILREEDGMPVLIDFGVIKDLQDTMIGVGTVIGSGGYAAPEQLAGCATYSSDLFSLGMVSIFLLTGQNPKTFIDPAAGMVRWWSNLPDWQQIDKHLFNTINKATSLSVRERFSTAEEMKSYLYNSRPRECSVFSPHIHTPYMWKVLPNWRSEFVKSDYDESMQLYPQDSGTFQRGKSWKIT